MIIPDEESEEYERITLKMKANKQDPLNKNSTFYDEISSSQKIDSRINLINENVKSGMFYITYFNYFIY